MAVSSVNRVAAWAWAWAWTCAFACACGLVGGCGRFGFDLYVPLGGDGDAGQEAPADACTFGPFGAAQVLANVNTTGDEYGAWLSADGLELVFTSNRTGNRDLYRATRSAITAAFDPPTSIAEVSTAANEDDAYVTPDGKELWFNRTSGTLITIFRATRQGATGPFGAPAAVPGVNQGGITSEGPFLTRDGLTIYFDSDRGGTAEIYRATRATTAADFGNVTRVVAMTPPKRAMSPELAADGVLFFQTDAFTTRNALASAAPDGGGGFLPPGIAQLSNGTTSEADPAFSPDGQTLIFGSTRAGGPGGYDLFQATRACQ